MRELPEEKAMWDERFDAEVLVPDMDSDEEFIPAQLATHEPGEEILIRIEL